MNRKGFKTIFSFALTIATLISLSACTFPFDTGLEPIVQHGATIKEVTITPPSGSGEMDFVLLLRYHRNFDIEVTISCYYLTPDGNTMGITSITDDGRSAPDQERTIIFNVMRAGVATPGVYTATCKDDSGKSSELDTFFVDDDPDAEVTILEVRVWKLSGRDLFGLEVSYLIRISDDVSFTCYYVSPEDVITINKFTEPGKILEHPRPLTKSKAFSVVRPTRGGVYTAKCVDDGGISTKSTTFTVEGDPIPPVNLPPALTGGTITYDEATEKLSPHKNPTGYYPSQHHKWCAITFNIGIDTTGNISGTCAAEGHDIASGLYGDWNGSATIEGTITGKAVPGGSFIFREELIEKNMPGDPTWGSTRKVIFEGKGSFVSPTRATGTATISAECSTVYTSSTLCGDDYSASDSFTGTINWEFNGTASP